MSAGWVAAGVRARGLARRQLGHEGARQLGASDSLATALGALAHTPYGREVGTEMDLASAEHAVFATLLWHMRILAGWGPPLGSGPLRLLAAGFEIANVTGHLARMGGQTVPPPYVLGSMATAWPAVSGARTPTEVRAALATSSWGDPGGEELATVRLALLFGWARRVLDGVPGAADWAITGSALVLCRVLAAGAFSALGPSARRDAGISWVRAGKQRPRRVSSPGTYPGWLPRSSRTSRVPTICGAPRPSGGRASRRRALRWRGARRWTCPRASEWWASSPLMPGAHAPRCRSRQEAAETSMTCWSGPMRWPEALEPARMERVAVVAPADRLRSVLVIVADAGVVQIEQVGDKVRGPAGEALERARRTWGDEQGSTAVLDPEPPDLAALEREGPPGVLAGEAELERVSASALRHGSVAALVGWSPTSALGALRSLLAPLGGAVVPLPAAWRRAADAGREQGCDRRVPAAGRHLRHDPLRGREPVGVRRPRLRRDVRHDVRRRRPRCAPLRRWPAAASGRPACSRVCATWRRS